MSCVNTGCHVWLSEYGLWAYGDAFLIGGGTYAFRLVAARHEPFTDVKHFDVLHIAEWWDRRAMTKWWDRSAMADGPRVSTLISTQVALHGYEGVKI